MSIFIYTVYWSDKINVNNYMYTSLAGGGVCSYYCHLFHHDRESEAVERESFRMVMVHQIDKDVVRTDRSHPYYQGDENTHVGTLK